MEMPMLDEDEYAIISELYRIDLAAAKEHRIKNNLPIEGLTVEELFRPVRENTGN